MSVKRRGIWCVEVLLRGGGHKFVIFDSIADASNFLSQVRGSTYQGVRVKDADLWEM